MCRMHCIVSIAFNVMHQHGAHCECIEYMHMEKRHIERCPPDMPRRDAAREQL